MIDVARSLREGADRLDRIFGLSTASALMRMGAGEIERIAAERDAAVRERDGLRAGITAPSTVAAGSCSSQTVYPAPPPAGAAAGDIATVQGVIDARGGPAAQAAWARLRGEIERLRGERDAAERERDEARRRSLEMTDRIDWLEGHNRKLAKACKMAEQELAESASPPAAPAPCPECGGCATCLGTGRLWRLVGVGWGWEQVPCPRCAAGRSARSAVTSPSTSVQGDVTAWNSEGEP